MIKYTYKELQAALKVHRDNGITITCKLNAKADVLSAELFRIESIDTPVTVTEVTEDTAITNLVTKQVDTKVTKAAKITARVLHTSRLIITLLTLLVMLVHQWDVGITNRITSSPHTRLIQRRSKQVMRFIYDVLKWHVRAQLGHAPVPI